MRRGLVLAVLLALAWPAAAGAESVVPKVPWGNDFGCRPGAEHPRPIVLLHGLGARGQDNWRYVGPRLKSAGYCVFALTYGMDPRTRTWPYRPGGTIRAQQSADEIREFVDRVLRATGAARVDFVGHSEGTVTPRWYLERLGGAAEVRRYVALTPLWRGTNLAHSKLLPDPGRWGPWFAELGTGRFCAFCSQAVTGSAFLADLNADGEAIPGIEHTNIITRNDELVRPPSSGIMRDGGTNIVLQDVCPRDHAEHAMVAFDANVMRMILNELDPAHARRVSCPGSPRG
jgi:pimeloyl-ACP methyl ester carboxylesterase